MESGIDINVVSGKVEDFIGEDSIERALEYVKDAIKEQETTSFCISQLGHLKRIEKENLKGVIKREDYYRYRSTIASNILDWVNSNIDQETKIQEEDEIEDTIDVSVDELESRLNIYLQSNRINTVYTFLERLVSNVRKLYIIASFKESFHEYVWKLNNLDFTIQDWDRKVEELIIRIGDFISSLEEKDLILKWKTEFLELSMGLRANDVSPLFALFSQADAIKVPDQILSKREKQRFKRLMYLYQDAYQAGEYKIAYEYCLQLRAEIEPESAQLYEYLMLSYFKMQKEDRIIVKALDGEMRALNYLFVYANRFKQLQRLSLKQQIKEGQDRQSKLKKIPGSETGDHNLKQIASGLMVALAKEYSRINYDYVTDFKEIDPKDFKRIKECITIGTKITQYVEIDLSFAEIIINELAGGNKNQWLFINYEGEIFEKEEMEVPAQTIINDTKRLITYHDRLSEEDASEILAENLFSSLEKKYLSLRRKKSSCRSAEKLLMLRKAIYKCIISYRIGTIIFPEQAKRFCATPIKELSGDGSILNWFTLSDEPNLILNEGCQGIDGINPREVLEYFILLENGKVSWKELKKELMQIEYQKLVRSTDKTYEKTTSDNYTILPGNLKIVRKTLRCLQDYYTCYAYEKDSIFLDKVYIELVGGGYFFWFKLYPKGLELHETLGADQVPASKLYNVISEHYSEEEFKQILSKNYFTKVIKEQYFQTRKKLAEGTIARDVARKMIYNLMLESSILYQSEHKRKDIIDFIYSEFIEEETFSWVAIEPTARYYSRLKGQSAFLELETQYGVFCANHVSRSLELDVISVIYDLFNGDENILKSVKDQIVNNIYAKDLGLYNSMELQANDLDASVRLRKELISIFSRFKMYFNITRDKKYLDVVVNEFLLNAGKVKWFWEFKIDIFPLNKIKFNHRHNGKLEGFSLWEERVNLRKYLQEVSLTS